MSPYWKSVLLFMLIGSTPNCHRGVRGGWATEGNALMASCLTSATRLSFNDSQSARS